jgi:hypothetical protein
LPILIANAVGSLGTPLIYPPGIPADILVQLPVLKEDAFAMTGKLCFVFSGVKHF